MKEEVEKKDRSDDDLGPNRRMTLEMCGGKEFEANQLRMSCTTERQGNGSK